MFVWGVLHLLGLVTHNCTLAYSHALLVLAFTCVTAPVLLQQLQWVKKVVDPLQTSTGRVDISWQFYNMLDVSAFCGMQSLWTFLANLSDLHDPSCSEVLEIDLESRAPRYYQPVLF